VGVGVRLGVRVVGPRGLDEDADRVEVLALRNREATLDRRPFAARRRDSGEVDVGARAIPCGDDELLPLRTGGVLVLDLRAEVVGDVMLELAGQILSRPRPGGLPSGD